MVSVVQRPDVDDRSTFESEPQVTPSAARTASTDASERSRPTLLFVAER